MAYAEIYYFTFTSVIEGRTFTASIEKDGYSGYPKEITVFPGRSPLVIEYQSEGEIYKPVRSSTATVTISQKESGLTTQELIDFVSAQEREFKLTITEDVGSGTQTIWVGWLQPMEELTLDLFNLGAISIVFIDGLAQLRNIALDYDISECFQYDKLKETIRRCLLLTGHTFDVQLINTIRESATNTPVWEHFSLSKAAYLRPDTGGFLDALTVLELLLTKIGCTVYQSGGKWFVQNFLEGEQSSTRGALMNDDGTGGGTLSTYTRAINPILTGRNFVARNGQARLVNPISQANVKAEYLSNRMGVVNWNFNTWTGAATDMPNEWTSVNSLQVLRQNTGISSQYSAYLRGYFKELDQPDRSMEYDGTQVQEGDKIIVGWEWEYLTLIGADTPIGRVSYLYEHPTDGTKNRYLDEDGEWVIPFTTIDAQKPTDVPVGDKIITVPGEGRIIVNAHNPKATTAVGEDQDVYYVRLWFCGFIHVKEGEREENPISFSKYKGINVRLQLSNVFSNATIEPVKVLGYEAKDSTEMPAANITDEVLQSFLGSEREAGNENQLVNTQIKTDFVNSIGTINRTVAYQILQFIRSNRFVIQGDFIGEALQIGDTYTYNVFTGEERKFICIGYAYDLKNDTFTTALLKECKLQTFSNVITDNIYE